MTLELREALRRTDIVPQSKVLLATDLAQRDRLTQECHERITRARSERREQGRMVHTDTRKCQARPAFDSKHPLPQAIVASWMMRWIADQHEVSRSFGRKAARYRVQPRKLEIAVDIAIGDCKRLIAQQRQCGSNAAGGFQRLDLAGIRDAHTECGAIAERGFEQGAEV